MNERPLRGKHVLITRGGEQGEKFCTDVASAGGVPYMVPLIDFRAHDDVNAPLFIRSLEQYDWIIFTSKNGVNYFFQHIHKRLDDFDYFKQNIKFAAVGEKTRDELTRRKIDSHFMPNIYTAEDFAREFFEKGLTAKIALIPKGNLAGKTIAESFRSRNIVADEWIVYDTYYPSTGLEKLVQLLKEDRLQIAAFTSPSTFNHFHKIVTQHVLAHHAKKLEMAAIGTVTKKAVEQAGYTVKVCPETFTIDSMFAEMCKVYGS